MKKKVRVGIGGDHAGHDLKEKVISHLKEEGYEMIDYGPYSADSVDYPDFVHPLCVDILADKLDCGILICGSGNGVAMTANKYNGIRCGLCWTPELAALAKQHNDANTLALPARFIKKEIAIEIVDAYLNSSFEGGRHQRRVDKIKPEEIYTC